MIQGILGITRICFRQYSIPARKFRNRRTRPLRTAEPRTSGCLAVPGQIVRNVISRATSWHSPARMGVVVFELGSEERSLYLRSWAHSHGSSHRICAAYVLQSQVKQNRSSFQVSCLACLRGNLPAFNNLTEQVPEHANLASLKPPQYSKHLPE